MVDTETTESQDLHQERWELLRQIDAFAEKPLIALAFVWLILLVIDLTSGLNPALRALSYTIWALFVLDFVISMAIAPDKSAYLRRNVLTVLALMLPALRIFRIFRALRILRAARTLRSVNLLRIVTSLNRGMRAVARTLGRRGVDYVLAITVIVVFAGAAGMFFFERSGAAVPVGQGFENYGDAVWWTAMIMTTIGSDYWPQTAEGRILSWLLSLYALAVFGYITATIASYLIGDSALQQSPGATPGGGAGDSAALETEIAALRQQIAALTTQLEAQAGTEQKRP